MFDFGFIGTGNMGSALARAVCKATDSVLLCDKTEAKAAELAAELGCKAGTITDVARECKYIFIGVKPQMLPETLSEISAQLKARADRYILVTMAAGTSIEKILTLADVNVPVIRIMPNVACAVGAGMVLSATNSLVTDEEYDFFAKAMASSGKMDKIDEKQIDNYSIVTGCGPAWTYLMIEALADGQVAIGVPRDKAYLYAAQMVEGSAKLMLETGKAPAQLKDSVCSPAGTTIEGVKALEKGSVRSDYIDAVAAAYKRTLELGKN